MTVKKFQSDKSTRSATARKTRQPAVKDPLLRAAINKAHNLDQAERADHPAVTRYSTGNDLKGKAKARKPRTQALKLDPDTPLTVQAERLVGELAVMKERAAGLTATHRDALAAFQALTPTPPEEGVKRLSNELLAQRSALRGQISGKARMLKGIQKELARQAHEANQAAQAVAAASRQAPGPDTPALPPHVAALKEMAERELARRSLLRYVIRMVPNYLAGWVHEDICWRLEKFLDDVVAGRSPRLGIFMPPRHGKSALASIAFPSWALGKYPDLEFISCSYGIDLARDFSRKTKAMIATPEYESLFETRVDPGNQGNEQWAVTNGRGGYVAAGVGGPITGRGASILVIDDPCIAEGQRVQTKRGLVPVEQVVVGDEVWTHRNRWRRVMATYNNGEKDVISLRAGLFEVLLTPEHKVYTTRGWVEARNAEDVYGSQVPAVWRDVQAREGDAEVLQQGVPGRVPAHGAEDLPGVQQCVPAEERQRAEVLRVGVREDGQSSAETTHVQRLWRSVRVGEVCAEILQRCLPERRMARRTEGEESSAGRSYEACTAARETEAGVERRATTVHALRGGLHAVARLPAVLLERLQERRALAPNEGRTQLELPSRPGCGPLFEGVQAGDIAAATRRGEALHRVRGDGAAGHAPPGREQAQQRTGEPCGAVQSVPHAVSQITQRGRATVYDLTVEEDHSFVAEGLVVHNCKNAEEAQSSTIKDAVWDWYGSTAYTRLAPGGGVLIIQTLWADDDLAGRVMEQMKDDPESDQFEIIKYPAMAVEYEYRHPTTRALVTSGEMLDPADAEAQGLVLQRMPGDALHPARYDIKKLNKIKRVLPRQWWAALYQQDPAPDEGAYFEKDCFRRGPMPNVRNCNVFVSWDFAISEQQQNDYTVGSVSLQDHRDVLTKVDQVRMKTGDGMKIADAMIDLLHKWYRKDVVVKMGVEDGQIWRSIKSYFKKRLKERRLYHYYALVEPLQPITDKRARAKPLQGRFQQGMFVILDGVSWYDTLEHEYSRFPSGKNDDIIDSDAWGAHLAMETEPPQPPKEVKLKSWRDKLKGHTGGGKTKSAMAA